LGGEGKGCAMNTLENVRPKCTIVRSHF